MTRLRFVLSLATISFTGVAFGQAPSVSLTSSNPNYSTTFDTGDSNFSQPSGSSYTWRNADLTTPTATGWYASMTGGVGTVATNTGTSTTGAVYNYGSTGSSERALGSI
jgi:hypothetical protein